MAIDRIIPRLHPRENKQKVAFIITLWRLDLLLQSELGHGASTIILNRAVIELNKILAKTAFSK